MFRLLNNNGKLIIAIVVLLFICIFVNRDANVVVVEESTQPSQNRSSLFSVHSPISNKPDKISSSNNYFWVFDHKCKIPRLDPFSEDVMNIFKPPKFKKCTNQPDLFTVRYDLKEKQYIVKFNESLFVQLFPNISDYGCVFHEIIRGPDDSLSWHKRSIFSQRDWIVPRHVQGIVVECFELRNRSRVLQRDAFSFVQYPLNCNEKNDKERSRTFPSVIMLGIDSMSQMNFQRTMPLTAHFVRQPGWYEMLGYNTIGDNIFQNFIILLTGRSSQQWLSFCNIRKPGCLDAIAFLWNHFHNSGYLTAYAEDIATFNFTRRPVDYYLNPIMKAFEKIMTKFRRLKYDYCLGRKQSFRYVFDYCLQLVQRFVHETPKPFFGIFWTKSFSNDDFSGAANVDKDFVTYLEQFKEHGLFERAVVILFSLHGQHKGPLMELSSSFLEERLPMLHIYLPPWYRKQYPKVGKALDVNRRRLSSTVDLHLTIKKLLLQVQPGISYQLPCASCKTLFEILPVNRSCNDAAIPSHCCSCEPHTRVPKSVAVKAMAKLVVYRIRQYLRMNNYDGQCYRLELRNLLRAYRKQYLDAKGNEVKSDDGFYSYRLRLTTRPKGAFRATVFTNLNANIVRVREELIERLNVYRNDSYCVTSPRAKEFCICRPSS
ncbi:uncharacterized protein [Drosophila virilis]|uniref:Uncharacterized protein n=1 Tax=Drosophila virilis TaxID=7244 RepID=B4LUY7_DROVI|nr:uncharacterized protein LOC6627391 isoform X1 [Drosophila virilis]EDW63236.1 uncharacterized protein Dvir_GJ14296 [Drosophila virilis]